jgi:hypothetical protein
MLKRVPRKAVMAGLLLVLVVLGISGFLYSRSDERQIGNNTTVITGSVEDKTPPPTEEEKQAAEQHKDDLIKQQEIENSGSSGAQKQVTPVITNAAQNEQQIFVGGYMPGIFENEGVCTFTFTKGATTLIKTSEAFANASTTDCKNLTIARSEFSGSGVWSVVLSYNSPNASGTSQAKSLTLQ